MSTASLFVDGFSARRIISRTSCAATHSGKVVRIGGGSALRAGAYVWPFNIQVLPNVDCLFGVLVRASQHPPYIGGGRVCVLRAAKCDILQCVAAPANPHE